MWLMALKGLGVALPYIFDLLNKKHGTPPKDDPAKPDVDKRKAADALEFARSIFKIFYSDSQVPDDAILGPIVEGIYQAVKALKSRTDSSIPVETQPPPNGKSQRRTWHTEFPTCVVDIQIDTLPKAN